MSMTNIARAVLRHFRIPEAEHDARLALDSRRGHPNELTKLAQISYLCIFNSMTHEEKRRAE